MFFQQGILSHLWTGMGFAAAAPWPQNPTRRDYRELDFLAVDLELSSLDPDNGEILSIGFVPVCRGEIIPAEGRHLLISDHGGVGDSAGIHGIRDCDRHRGLPLESALAALDRASADKTLIFHHARLDLNFLKRAGFADLPHWVVDTLLLEQRRLRQRQQIIGCDQLRLYQCRERYHLPQRSAHNAFTDALATAELFLAQAAYMAGSNHLSLKELVA